MSAELPAAAVRRQVPAASAATAAPSCARPSRASPAAAATCGALGVSRVALLGNNPDKAGQLRRYRVTVAGLVPTAVHLSPAHTRYLDTKARRGAHALDLPRSAGEAS